MIINFQKYLIHLPFLLVVLNSCIEPIDLQGEQISGTLVVDGLITDQDEPYTVRLFYSLNDEGLYRTSFISNAQVIIRDDKGNSTTLVETDRGIYESDQSNLKGEVGNSYTLEIITEDGKVYQSSTEKMLPNAGLSDIITSFESRDVFNHNGIEQTLTGYNVDVVSNNDPELDNLYRLRYIGTYEIKTFPELRGQERGMPDPFPCSGYEVFQGAIMPTSPCTCCTCWVKETSPRVILSDPNIFRESSRVQNLFFFETNQFRFYNKYHIEIQQLSLTPEAYNFWSIVQGQQQGGLFQAPPGEIISNIRNINNPEEKVLGYFYASSVASQELFIYKEDVPEFLPLTSQLPIDCRLFDDGSSTERPPFW